MPKTVPPGKITIPRVATFEANAVPDAFDSRDLEYRPRLEPLLPELDQRTLQGRYVMHQLGQACTGHAVATVINTVLARATSGAAHDGNGSVASPAAAAFPHVSPYMLYRLGRRYDEFEGEEDAGSSLRGVFKGWFHHGAALEEDWHDLEMAREPDLDDPDDPIVQRSLQRPLGAYYRVNAFRLDDMQSAINELHALAVSARIHDGWVEPVPYERGGETIRVIARRVDGKSLGGHAFALVGYNEVGFLVQNSWGPDWGKGGFATLPYEDWLDSAYDAWVARPGVPRTRFAAGRSRTVLATGGEIATGPAPDLKRLARHVVNLGNNGRLSTTGKFVSTPAQIERAFEHMATLHEAWEGAEAGAKRHVLLYAHGGLTDEADGLETAQKHLNWWLNNRVYPIYFAWQSGPAETLLNQLVDSVKGRLPFGLAFDFAEQFDRLVEKVARQTFTWMWEQMKQNAEAASDALAPSGAMEWPPRSSSALQHMAVQPGASLTVSRLAEYIAAHGPDTVRVHLVGHSAGAIFLAPLLDRLQEAGIAIESLAFLAPAMRVDAFRDRVLPHLGAGKTVARFATFALSDQRELDDACGVGNLNVYQKSLLYLVSRALESPKQGDGGEVPLLGMARFFDRPLSGKSGPKLQEAIESAGGACVFSRSASPTESRSDATTHGGFDDDAPTMTSVVMRVRGATSADGVDDFVRDAALHPIPGLTAAPEAVPAPPAAGRAGRGAPTEPMRMAAAGGLPGASPVARTQEPQTERPVAPPTPSGPIVEVADAPRTGSPVLDLLEESGWSRADVTSGTDAAPRPRRSSARGSGRPAPRRRR